MDFFLFQKVNVFAGQSYYWDLFFILSTDYLIWGVMFAVLLVEIRHIITSNKNDYLYIIQAFFASGLAWFINNLIIAQIYFRSRPFVLHTVNQLVPKPSQSKSFPSDHTTIAFAFAYTIFLHSKRTGQILLVLALLIGISRVFVGVHYPFDVLGGVGMGIFTAYIVHISLHHFNKIKKMLRDK